ncbi:hypothetical protein J7E41_10185 [Pseudomonas fluorescens]|nr:hypothetical protein [Pseudomonas fluorescens]
MAQGAEALLRLLPIALCGSSHSRILGRFLLTVYDGDAFFFEPRTLRALDTALIEDCLKVLMMDYASELRVHEHVPDGGRIWQELEEKWRAETP